MSGKGGFLLGLFFWTGAVSAAEQHLEPVAVILNDAQGKQVGDVNLTEEVNGVQVIVNLKDLPPGTYALHFHENGKCEGPDFKSAGDHFNPEKRKHGNVKGGPHAGDMKNIKVEKDGTGHLEEKNARVTLKEGANSLLKKGGTSVILHERADDMKSQPAGNAGKRIACGEIKSPEGEKK
ncbi:superoxide dismutase family protein [Bdellovibrio sp. 22V]|uniref:superoxide dismutase family protein n=1 Tax=Bdellovibrio sp. 22V TaxID=3044166 RepID=UPI002543CF4F|nr:superoxide dismutase family protein [Bdellovibrio sp. 22V]WII72445.1 superoxide dismutase family protein [Bdellovibrio sp. 22V]